MHTSVTTAVLPVAQNSPAPARNDGNAESTAPDAPFSHVLTRQHGNEATRHADGATRQAQQEARKPGQPQAEAADIDHAAVAQTVAEQGLTLPQIALNIAAEVAAVRQSGLANAVKHYSATGVPTQADPAARAQSSSHVPDVTLTAPLIAAQEPAVPALGVPALGAMLQTGVAPSTTPRNPLLPASTLPVNKAASIAGARQAVLTMQARQQAMDPAQAQAKVGSALPEVFTPMANPNDGLFTAAYKAAPADTGLMHTAAASAGALPIQLNPAPGGALLQPTGIAAPLHSPQWAAELGNRFVSITQGNHNMPHTAELRLDPPELGPLRISINLNDNVAHAVFVSAHASVRQSVENALPQLQQMLAQAGISLGQTSVNDQGQPDQAFNDTFGQGQAQGRDRSNSQAGAGEGNSALGLRRAARSPAPNALVDTFA